MLLRFPQETQGYIVPPLGLLSVQIMTFALLSNVIQVIAGLDLDTIVINTVGRTDTKLFYTSLLCFLYASYDGY